VLSNGPAGDVTNSTYMYCDVPRSRVGYWSMVCGQSGQYQAVAIGVAFVLTNNAEWELAQATEFAYQRRMFIASIIDS